MALKITEMRRKSKTRKRILIAGCSVLTAAVLVIGSVCFLLNTNLLQKGEGSLDNGINTKYEIKEKVVSFLICGIDDEEGRGLGQRTDVILYVNYDVAAKEVHVLQIPRDTYVESTSSNKINAVYSESKEGIKGLADELHEMFQLPIDYYATIKMDGFKELVNALGGVTVDVPVDIDWGGIKLYKGVQTLDGDHAEMLVRERHAYFNGDIGRIQTQRRFFAALFQKLMSLSGAELLSLVPTALNYISTDMTAAQVLSFLDSAKSLQMSSIVMHLLPGEGIPPSYANYTVHLEKTAELLNESFRPYSVSVDSSELNCVEVCNTTDAYDNITGSLDSFGSSGSSSSKNQ